MNIENDTYYISLGKIMAESSLMSEFIASQNSLQNKCRRVCSKLRNHFKEHLLDRDGQRFFLEITPPKYGEFYIWIYNENKVSINYGIKCSAVLQNMQVSLIRSERKVDGSLVFKPYRTKGFQRLFPFGEEYKNEEELISSITETANLLVSDRNIQQILTPEKK